jgi:hypothetical protein
MCPASQFVLSHCSVKYNKFTALNYTLSPSSLILSFFYAWLSKISPLRCILFLQIYIALVFILCPFPSTVYLYITPFPSGLIFPPPPRPESLTSVYIIGQTPSPSSSPSNFIVVSPQPASLHPPALLTPERLDQWERCRFSSSGPIGAVAGKT